jgi:hypothetical protein
MLGAFQFLATLCAGLFAGAALYINVAEHPARVVLDDTRAAATQWALSYKRATFMQVPLALISLAGGTAAWLLGANAWWLVAGLLIGAVVPFTLLAIMPTNHELLARGRDLSSVDTRRLLERWNRLHAVRSALSLIATVLFAWQATA